MTHGRVTALELTRQLAAARLRRRRKPLYLVHALTARCNARCGFCAWNPDFYDPSQQLSTEAIERLYTDAREAGFVGLSIWGGEPLLHRHFGRVVRHARELGFVTNMVTNGFLLDRRMDDVIANVDRVCISLDFPSSKHDEVRRIPGLFDRIVSATEELRRRDPDKVVVFICTLQKGNVDPSTVRELARLMRRLGVLGVFNGMREEAASETEDTGIDEHAPSQEQLTEAFVALGELKSAGYPVLNSFTHIDQMRDGPPVYRCHWPKLMLPVEANGDVVDCQHWGTRPLGNLKEQPLSEILQSPRLRALMGEAGERCHECVSIHRVEISEAWDGNLEPIKSWRLLRKPPQPSAASAPVRGRMLARERHDGALPHLR